VIGQQRVPVGHPLVVVANHVSGLVDPLLILGTLPVTPRFLAKHTLFRNPLIAPFLRLAGVLPVYRPRDSSGAQDANREVFARCRELLATGGSIALFPEGTSHSEPALVPLRTGAARIVLETEAEFPGLGVRVLPVGLTFEAKGEFRSRALVQIGEPLDPAPEVQLAVADAAPAVRALTARIDAALKSVTLNYGSWDEARLIGRAAEIFARRDTPLPTQLRLGERFALHRVLIDNYSELARAYPERTAAAAAAIDSYDRLLAAARLRDDQVVAAYPWRGVARFAARMAFRLLVHLPLAAVGILLNWPTYRLVGTLAGRLTDETDLPATYKLFGGLLLFPATWLAEAWGAAVWAHRAGMTAPAAWLAGVATALLAPASAYAALRFDDARARLVRESRAFLLLRARGRLADELKGRRLAARHAVDELAGLAGVSAAPEP
jgi:glycerol-3-phosphate O-acyltransferase/dihydroxyacetone phosphate acyltransferase